MKNLIINYVNTMSIDDIKKYALKKNINITNDEAIIIYDYIKNNYLSLLDGDETSLIKLKYKLYPELYNTIISLYKENKNKYF